MQSGQDRRNFLQMISWSCFGRLNLKAIRPELRAREKALRNALRGSVGKLLEGPRFSGGVINSRDLTWKGRGAKEADASAAVADAHEHDSGADSAAEYGASSPDWSAVGYDPKYRTIRRLNEQEELRFVALAKVGDSFAQQKLIIHHLPLLKMVARRYAGKGLALSELVNEGTFGLVRAVERFDLGRELRFGTYAKWWIRDAIEQALLKQSRMIRLPGHVVRNMREQQKNATQEMQAAAMAGDAPGTMEEAGGQDTHFHEHAHEHEHEQEPMHVLTLSDRSSDEAAWDERAEDKTDGADETTPEMILDEKQRRECLVRALMQLSERERTVLVRRFGLHSDEPETLEEVAAELGVSYERVRQIQKAALTKLKSYMAAHGASASFE